MKFIHTYFWLFSTFLVPLLYMVVASCFYVALYSAYGGRFKQAKIQPLEIAPLQFRREMAYSLLSLSIFAAMGFVVFLIYHSGLSSIYLDIRKYGIIYLVVSVCLMIVFHDMYFYWTHRLLHEPGWYQRVHRIHHLSSNPSPFTSLAFHPVEAVIQAAVLPLMVIIIPSHPYSIFSFLLYMVYKNVRGHAGYEFTSAADRRSKWNRLHSYSIHHNEHHLFGRGNYGLYFTVWDRLMRTFRN